MTAVIEALHIYDERNNPILTHTYTGRPLPAAQLLGQYLDHPAPRPSLMYLPNAAPPTLVFSLSHANLLLLAAASREAEPLLVLEFLHRVVDSLEEFLGAPLTAQRVESGHDVAAQLLTEMCDAGLVATTEPNALRDLVEVEGWVGKLLGSIPNLPGGVAGAAGGLSLGSSSVGGGHHGLAAQHHLPRAHSAGAAAGGASSALPWRRANVRHTSNELYVDLVETLSVSLAPSGRPLAAFAHGTVAFTSKVSGVPDILLTLSGPSGPLTSSAGTGLAGGGGGGGKSASSLSGGGVAMELPVFHPCVRLARWRERPSELSFVPPDGRFILASYEVDLLPFTSGKSGSLAANNLRLPVSIEMKTGLGPVGADFEVRVSVNKAFAAAAAAAAGVGGGRGGALGGGPGRPGTAAAPLLEDLRITVPLPAGVRNLPELRPSKGDAAYSPGDGAVEWSIPTKALGGTTYFALRCTVVGQPTEDEDEEAAVDDPMGFGGAGFKEYSTGDEQQAYQSASPASKQNPGARNGGGAGAATDDKDEKRTAQNRMLMPGSAAVSFSVKGWLPSGIKVESIAIDPRKSRGLGESVKPYKGVKYLTVSKGGIEIRC